MDDYSYENYFKEFEDIYDRSLKAKNNVESHSVMDNIYNQLSDTETSLSDMVNSSYLNGSSDDSIFSFVGAMNQVLSNTRNVKSFFGSEYENAENTYKNLYSDLDLLKNKDSELLNLCNSCPKKPVFDFFNEYQGKLDNWKESVTSLKGECVELVSKINEELETLEGIDIDVQTNGITGISKSSSTIQDFKDQYLIDFSDKEELLGEELMDYINAHPYEWKYNTRIYKKVVNINGVETTIYLHYDVTWTDEQHKEFEKFVSQSIYYESMVDKNVLSLVDKAGFDFSFREHRASETREIYGATTLENNIVIYYTDEVNCPSCIIHETGHALDRILGNLFVPYADYSDDSEARDKIVGHLLVESDFNTYSPPNSTFFPIGVNEYGFNTFANALPDNDKDEKLELLRELWYSEDGVPGSWGYLAGCEADYFDEGIVSTDFSHDSVTFANGVEVSYGVDVHKAAYNEYFADAFRAYYLCDDREYYQEYCPKTYSQIEKILSFVDNHYDYIYDKLDYLENYEVDKN